MKQMIPHTTKVVVALFLVAGLFACNEDKGNYDYTEISSVTKIDNIGESYSRTLEDSLIIRPKLSFNTDLNPQVNQADFTYAWWIETGGGDNGRLQLLRTGRDLEIVVDTPTFEVNKGYKLVYEITDKKTNIPYRRIFSVSIRNLYAVGYVALCQKTAGLELDIVADYDNKFTLYTDLLELMSSDLDRSATPRDIVTAEVGFAPSPLDVQTSYSVFILTDQYTTRLLPTDYSWKPSYDISNMVERNSYLDSNYVRTGKPIIAKQLRYSYRQSDQQMRGYILMLHEEENGEKNWYLQKTHAQFSNFSVQMNRIRTNDLQTSGKERYEPAPFVAMTSSGNISTANANMFYDVTGKRFAVASVANGPNDYGTSRFYYSEPINRPGGIGENPTPYRITDDIDTLLYMGEQIGSNRYANRGFAVRKLLSNGNIQYIDWMPQGNSPAAFLTQTPTAKQRICTFPGGSQIENAKFYARVPDNASAWLYYATNDNRVFKASLSGSTAVETEITDLFVKDGYSEITAFKFTRPESTDRGGRLQNALVVATYNAATGLDTGGKVELFLSNNTTGDVEVAKYPEPEDEDDEYQIMSFTGLGKVVGLTYKRQ